VTERFRLAFPDAFECDAQYCRNAHVLMTECRDIINSVTAGLAGPAFQVELNFLYGETLNAKATVVDGYGCIGVNFGTYKVLETLFDHMLSEAGFFRRIGHSSLEFPMVECNVENKKWHSMTNGAEDRPHRPRCPIRADLSAKLLRIAFIFLCLHELGHILCGHIEWRKATFGINSIDEENSNPNPRLSSVARFALEMDADCFAICKLVDWTRHIGAEEFDLGQPDNVFFYSTIAVLSLFRIYSDFEIDSEAEVYNKAHPPAFVRRTYVYANLFQYISTWISRFEIEPLHQEILVELTSVFFRLNGRRPPRSLGSPADGLDPIDLHNHIRTTLDRSNVIYDQLREAWQELRSDLEQFKRVPQLP
jgi:hypothetical protein